MATITAAMVKELRDATGAGMMDCKKALVAADGNMQAAIDAMRKSGAAKAAKKAGPPQDGAGEQPLDHAGQVCRQCGQRTFARAAGHAAVHQEYRHEGRV